MYNNKDKNLRFGGGFNPDYYFSDYYQLGFVLTEKKWLAIAIHEGNTFQDIRVMYIKLWHAPKKFEKFIIFFLNCWQHEYEHIIGLSHADMDRMMWKHTINVE